MDQGYHDDLDDGEDYNPVLLKNLTDTIQKIKD